MSSIGLPGLNGFASEFLTLLGTFGQSEPHRVRCRLHEHVAVGPVVRGRWRRWG